MEQSEGRTITVSKDSLGGHECEVGDTLTFTVMSKSDDGSEATLRFNGYEGGEEEEPTV